MKTQLSRLVLGVVALGSTCGAGIVALNGTPAGATLTSSCLSAPSTTTVSASPSYNYIRGCINSFDGTPIVYNLFEPLGASSANPADAILEGPGWGGAGSTSPDGQLITAGYAEMTWDPRGFGQSGGVAEVDSPASEGADVIALIGQVLGSRPEIAKDSKGPIVGMTGYSYGGGIEFAASADDAHGWIRAIAPGWAWNDLDYSLFPGNVVKLGWDELLYGAGLGEGGASHLQGDVASSPSSPTIGGTGGIQTGGYDPMIQYAETTGTALGYPDTTSKAWFHQRSMAEYGLNQPVKIPTLLIQGTVDTLFNLNDAWANYQEITAQSPGTVVKMIAYCGGHVSCPTGSSPTGIGYSNVAPATSPLFAGQSAGAVIENATIAWFNEYLRNQPSSTTNPDGMPATVLYETQDGSFHGTSQFPVSGAPGSATYQSSVVPGANLVSTGVPSNPSTVAGLDTAVTDGPSVAGPQTLNVPLTGLTGKNVVGEPNVSLNVTVNGQGADLYFKLVDATTNQVLDLQTSAIRLDNLDLANNAQGVNVPIVAQNISLDLAGVAYAVGTDNLELQITTSSTSYTNFRGPAIVTINSGTVSVPTLG